MNLRFCATSTSSTRSGWLRKRIDLGPNRAQTRSPYWRCQRVSAPRRSRLNSRRFPESQCCRGPGGRSIFVLVLAFVLMLIFLKLSLLTHWPLVTGTGPSLPTRQEKRHQVAELLHGQSLCDVVRHDGSGLGIALLDLRGFHVEQTSLGIGERQLALGRLADQNTGEDSPICPGDGPGDELGGNFQTGLEDRLDEPSPVHAFGQARQVGSHAPAAAIDLVATVATWPLGMKEDPFAGRGVGRAFEAGQPGFEVGLGGKARVDRGTRVAECAA